MNRILLTTLLFLNILAFISCNSDDEFIQMPLALYPAEVTNLSELRMFSNYKEIADPDLIERYTNDIEFFNSPNHYTSYFDSESVLFTSIDSMILFNGNLKSEETFNVKRYKNQFLFYEVDYEFRNSSIAPMSISQAMLKYPIGFVPVDTSILSGYTLKKMMVGYGSYKDLEVSCIAYKIIKLDENSFDLPIISSTTFGIVLNEFNPKVISRLGKRDILAIQEFRIHFRAK